MAGQKGKGKKQRRTTKAPILDLDATEVTEQPDLESEPEQQQAESQEGTQPRSEQPQASAYMPSGWVWRTAGIVGVFVAGIAAGAWLYKDLAADSVSTSDFSEQKTQLAELTSRLDTLEKENADLKKSMADNDRSETLQKALDAAEAARRKADEASTAASDAGKRAGVATERAEQANAATETLKSGLAETHGSIGELKTAIEAAASAVPDDDPAAGETMKAIQANLSALALKVAELQHRTQESPATTGETDARVSTLEQSLATLEADLKALRRQFASARNGANLTEAQSRLASALAGLRTAVAEGRPFAAQAEVIRARYPDNENVQVLGTHATSGVQTMTSLVADLSKLRRNLESIFPEASDDQATQDGSITNSILTAIRDRLSVIVKVRPAGTRDWSAVVRQMEVQARKGNLAEAVDLVDSTGETPPDMLADWMNAARARVAVDKALAAISDTAMTDLAGTRGTGG